MLRTIFFDIGMRLIKGRAFVYTYKAQEQSHKKKQSRLYHSNVISVDLSVSNKSLNKKRAGY